MQPEVPELLVFANDVEVGRLSVDQLKAIKKSTLGDWRTYASQAVNLVSLVLNVLWRIVAAAPLVWFWLMAAMALCQPEGFREMLVTGMPDPGKVAQGFITSLHLSLFISGVAVLAEAAIAHNRFGFVNYYSAGVNRRIRQKLKLPVESTLVLVHPRFNKTLPAQPGHSDQPRQK